MGNFKLPPVELRKLRKYKNKLLAQQQQLDSGELQDTPLQESIAKSSGISQVLKALEPKGKQIGTDYKGAITTESGRELPLNEPIYEKKDPTRQSFRDAFKIASEYGLPTTDITPKPLTKDEFKAQEFLKEWGIEPDPDLDSGANITAGLNQVFPDKRDQYIKGSEALFAKPKEDKSLSATKQRTRIELKKYIKEYDKSLMSEWKSEDDTLDNLDRITDSIEDEDKKLEFIKGAEGLFGKKRSLSGIRSDIDKALKNLQELIPVEPKEPISEERALEIEDWRERAGESIKQLPKERQDKKRKLFKFAFDFSPMIEGEVEPSATGVAIGTEAIKQEDAIAELKRRGLM